MTNGTGRSLSVPFTPTARALVVPYDARLTLVQYGLAHALVDATTAGLVLSTRGVSDTALFAVILLYNTLAFAPQFAFGALVDRFRDPRPAAAGGCALAALAVPAATLDPFFGAAIAGVGNALFHVGGGSVVLRIAPGKAAGPGIFVAPGGLGLFAGIMMGKTGAYPGTIMVLLMGLCCAAALLVQGPPAKEAPARRETDPDLFEAALILILLVVTVRALAAMTAVFPWKSGAVMGGALALSMTLGKGLGGVISDRYGWRRVAVTSLVLSAPLMTFLGDSAALGLIGAFLFQVTMAVTLTSVAVMFPARPAFAFGLPCLALWVGALPAFTPYKAALGNDALLCAVILVSALLLYGGLGLLTRMGIGHAGTSSRG